MRKSAVFNFMLLLLQIGECVCNTTKLVSNNNTSEETATAVVNTNRTKIMQRRNTIIIPNIPGNKIYYIKTNMRGRKKATEETVIPVSNLTTLNETIEVENHDRHVLSKVIERIDNEDIVFRVVNGQAARTVDLPWQVALVKKKSKKSNTCETFCGGALIGPARILSAAHCFGGNKVSDCYKGEFKKADFRQEFAVVGSTRATITLNPTQGKQNLTIQYRNLIHGSYPETFKFPNDDIAVLHVNKPFFLRRTIRPIAFASKRMEYKGNCQASGYGTLNKTQMLMKVKMTVIPTETCNKVFRRDMSHFVCTSDVKADVSKGDSGAPFVCFKTGDPKEKGASGLVVGVVAGKNPSRQTSTYFTRVTSYQALVNKASIVKPLHTLILLLAVARDSVRVK